MDGVCLANEESLAFLMRQVKTGRDICHVHLCGEIVLGACSGIMFQGGQKRGYDLTDRVLTYLARFHS